MAKFADRLREERKRRNMSQMTLALLADATQGGVSAWEAGRSETKQSGLDALSKALGVSPAWLSGVSDVRREYDQDYMLCPGDNMLKARVAAGMTRREAADALGVTCGALGKWELGLREPPFHIIRKATGLYGTDPDDMMMRKKGRK